MRLDTLVFQRGLCESRTRAAAYIRDGRVTVDGAVVRKPSFDAPEDAAVTLDPTAPALVSRAQQKLDAAMARFALDCTGLTVLDVGASTGGFTDVMLRAGARQVYSVDVGYNLLDYRLRSDARVVCMERTNARFLKPEDFPERPDFGATDVSFISLKAVLPAALSVLLPGGRFAALIKPQFEAPKEDVGEKGVVRDPAVHARVLRDITEFIPTLGWRVNGLDFSPIRGPEGNIEFLLDLVEENNAAVPAREWSVDDALSRAYDKFMKLSPEGL